MCSTFPIDLKRPPPPPLRDYSLHMTGCKLEQTAEYSVVAPTWIVGVIDARPVEPRL
jgi:hypothetical protein